MLPNGVNRKKRHSFQYEVATGVAIQRSFTSPSRSRDRMVITVTRGTVQNDPARLPHEGKTCRKAPALCLHLELARLCRCCCSAFLSRKTMAGSRNRSDCPLSSKPTGQIAADDRTKRAYTKVAAVPRPPWRTPLVSLSRKRAVSERLVGSSCVRNVLNSVKTWIDRAQIVSRDGNTRKNGRQPL
jgi:hypothetical protein